MLYLTRPVVIQAEPSDIGRDERFDFFARNARDAYGRPAAEPAALPEPIREGLVTIETYGAAAVRMSLARHRGTPAILYDCRAVPASDSPAASYRLAAAAGLRSTPPVMLSGQGGIEALQAMRFHACSVEPGVAVLVSSRGIGGGGSPGERPFGAACLASLASFGGEEIRIRSIHLERGRSGLARALERAARAMARAGMADRPRWIAASALSEELASWAKRQGSIVISRRSDRNGPEGSDPPDPLTMLDLNHEAIAEGEIGILACVGSTGSVGIASLSVHREGSG